MPFACDVRLHERERETVRARARARARACMWCAGELCVRASVHMQVNEKFASIFGYTAAKMLEQKIGQFCTGKFTEVLRFYTLVRMHMHQNS